MKEYHLILPANPNNEHAAGESAGSVLSHWFHLKKLQDKGVKEPGVMWFWHFQDTGIKERSEFNLAEINENKLPLVKRINDEEVKISDVGFIFEANHRFTPYRSSIAWRFRASSILSPQKVNNSLKNYENFIPFFRKTYLNWDEYSDQKWLLIKELKQLEKPVRVSDGVLNGFKRFYHNNQEFGNLKVNILQKNVFAILSEGYPKLKDPNPSEELDLQLKKLLTSIAKDKLNERMIHEAFLMQKLSEGCKIFDEGQVVSGRFDTLFQEPSGRIVAVEFKLGEEGTSAAQLKSYINDIKKNKQKWGIEEDKDISGEIICGNPRKKYLEGFKVSKWNLSISFS